jgi:hypothetical protein
MDDLRLDFPNRVSQPSQLYGKVGVSFAQTHHTHVAGEAVRVRPEKPHRADHMLETGRIQVVDYINQAIFEASLPEVIHHVHDSNRHNLRRRLRLLFIIRFWQPTVAIRLPTPG